MRLRIYTMRIQNIGKVIAVASVTLFPFVAFAQVVINEVMYNPEGSDTGREWIELYNTGASDVTMVSGSGSGSWRIGDSSNHTLINPVGGVGRGSLTIPAGGYLIIASDPATFIAEYPGGSYSVVKSSISLNNTSATTSLIDGTGTLLDSFTYANETGGNGDGTSLQKNDGSWIAALPTPGAANATTSDTPPGGDTNSNSNTDTGTTTTTTTTTTTSANTLAPTSSYVAPPEPQIFADAGDNRTVIVAADTEFLGRAYNRKKETISEHVRYLWNFGDGRTAEGQSVLHHFEYPGRYAVVLQIAENRDAASDRIIVTAEPAKLALASFPDGSVMIENNAGRDLDLSNWIIRSFGRSFLLPKDSIILAGESLRIGEKTLGFRSSLETELEYPNGVLAYRAETASGNLAPEEFKTPVAVLASASYATASVAISKSEAAANGAVVSKAEPEALADSSPTQEVVAEEATTTAQVASAGDASSSPYIWWFGALGLAVVGGGALAAARHAKKREWDIVEEIAE